MPADDDLTLLLRAWVAGDASAKEAAVSLAYAELRRIASSRLRDDLDTLSATGLVHEAFLKLNEQHRIDWQNRAQFFAIAANVMRRILVDRHRARSAQKRGASVTVALDEDVAGTRVDLGHLDHALDALARQDERQARVVELRYFGGLTLEQTAEAMNLSLATVKREWTLARAWLKRELQDGG